MRGQRQKLVWLFLVGLLVVGGVACQQQMPDTRAADEQAIRALSAEAAQAAGAKDLDNVVSMYAEDGSVFPPNAPAVTGRDAIRQFWQQLIGSPGYALSWEASMVEVARSGDLAYETGTYELTVNDPKGNPVTTKGKYMTVLKKQADGSWKLAADIFNADE